MPFVNIPLGSVTIPLLFVLIIWQISFLVIIPLLELYKLLSPATIKDCVGNPVPYNKPGFATLALSCLYILLPSAYVLSVTQYFGKLLSLALFVEYTFLFSLVLPG